MTSTELVRIPRHIPAPPAAKLLAIDVAAYLLNKKKRLTTKSQISYHQYLRVFVDDFPDHTLEMFEPPTGSLLLEDFLNRHWGERAPATYNKGHSVLSDFFSWHVKRMNLMRDPMLVIERAKRRQYHRTTFSEEQCVTILTSNPYPRAQIALRLLLFYGIRKGAALHNLWYRWLARAGIVAKGVTRGNRMHGARHASAQRVLDKTGNIKAAQKLLGHSNSAVTEAYTQFSDDQLGDAMGTVLGGMEAGLSKTLQTRVSATSRRTRG